ncbi:unnamed protein product, partial [Lota lota]
DAPPAVAPPGPSAPRPSAPGPSAPGPPAGDGPGQLRLDLRRTAAPQGLEADAARGAAGLAGLGHVHQRHGRAPRPHLRAPPVVVPPGVRPLYAQPHPSAHAFFQCRFFLWAPYKMWAYKLVCPTCGRSLTGAGLYRTVRRVLDTSGWYFMGTEYL